METFVRVRCTACKLLVRVPRRAGSHVCSECGALLELRVPVSNDGDAAKAHSQPGPGSRPSLGNSRAATTPRVLHRRMVHRMEQLRLAYMVAAAWGLSAVLIAFKSHDGRTTVAILGILMLSAVALHVTAFRRIRTRPVFWSTVVAIQTTFFVGLSTLGLFVESGLFLTALGVSYLTVWPGLLLALAFGIAITFEIFVVLSWCWVALTWWIVREARRLEQFEEEPRVLPMPMRPAPADLA